MNTSPQSNEKDQIVTVLLRHRFLAASGPDLGFCGGPYCREGIVTAAAHASHVADMLMALPPGVEGRSDPTGGDGYVPGAWDEVRSAYLDGHISAAAYDALRALVFPPGGESND